MLSIFALVVFVIGLLMLYLPGSKLIELGRAMMWVGLAVLVYFAATWHAVNL